MDWVAIVAGGMLIAISIHRFRSSGRSTETFEGWQERMEQLKNGAPEAFFEERRQLQSYPPSRASSSAKLRLTGLIGIAVGALLVTMGMMK